MSIKRRGVLAGGAALVISQFTLLGDCTRGTRPSFSKAEQPDRARRHHQPAFERAGSVQRDGVHRDECGDDAVAHRLPLRNELGTRAASLLPGRYSDVALDVHSLPTDCGEFVPGTQIIAEVKRASPSKGALAAIAEMILRIIHYLYHCSSTIAYRVGRSSCQLRP